VNHLIQKCEIGTDINRNCTILSGTHRFVSYHYKDTLRLYPTNLMYAESVRNNVFTKHNTRMMIIMIMWQTINLSNRKYA
jgi:hypothetical protein